jgi:malate dehydrogenase (oxaloacetate-decarboxylating)(NADP+)
MEASDIAANAYGGAPAAFGPEYLIPQPFDPRLLVELAPAVAQAAMDSGIATRPIADMDAYRETLWQFVFRTGLMMKPVFTAAKRDRKRVCYAEGEEETVLRAVQTVVDEGLAWPVLIGRPAVIERRIQRIGLRIRAGRDFELVNIDDDPRFNSYWQLYHELMQRKGVTPAVAKAIVRSRATAVAALALRRGEVDALICGLVGRYQKRVRYVLDILGLDEGVHAPAAVTAVINSKGTFFFLDTHVQVDPDAEMIAESTLLAAERLRWFGIEPKVALLSHSNFGSHADASAAKMRQACAMLREMAPGLEVEGEMHGDAALSQAIRERLFPNSQLTGAANLFVMPNLDSANIALNLVRTLTDGVVIGPMLLGVRGAAHVLTPSSTVRRVVNMTALAAVDAQQRAGRQAGLQF